MIATLWAPVYLGRPTEGEAPDAFRVDRVFLAVSAGSYLLVSLARKPASVGAPFLSAVRVVSLSFAVVLQIVVFIAEKKQVALHC